MGLVDRALAVPGRHDRCPESLGERRDLCPGLGQDRASARHDDGSLGRAKQVRRAFHVVRGRPNPASGFAPRRIRQDDLRGLGLDVHRQVQQDRPGPAGQHRVPGPMEDERQVVDARRLPPFLDDRLEDSRVVGVMAAVEFLEDAVAAHVGVRRAGDERNGSRIDIGRAHADKGVHRTRADAREGQHRPAARAEVAVRKMDGRLFVHHLDRPDAVRSVEQGVGDGPAAVAGNPGREFNVVSDEKLDDDLGAGKGALGRIAQRSGVSAPLVWWVGDGPCNRLTKTAAKR